MLINTFRSSVTSTLPILTTHEMRLERVNYAFYRRIIMKMQRQFYNNKLFFHNVADRLLIIEQTLILELIVEKLISERYSTFPKLYTRDAMINTEWRVSIGELFPVGIVLDGATDVDYKRISVCRNNFHELNVPWWSSVTRFTPDTCLLTIIVPDQRKCTENAERIAPWRPVVRFRDTDRATTTRVKMADNSRALNNFELLLLARRNILTEYWLEKTSNYQLHTRKTCLTRPFQSSIANE